MDKQQLLVEYLQNLVDAAFPINDAKIFMHKLYAYSIEIFSNPALKKPISIIYDEAAKMDAHLATTEQDGFDELISREAKIRTYVDCNRVKNQGVIQSIDLFQARLKKNEPFCRAMYFTPLEFAFSHLLNDDEVDHSVFMQEFGQIRRINDDRRIDAREAFPKFCAWENECYYVFQNKEVSGYHALRQLWVFLERYDGKLKDKIVNKLIINGQNTLELYTQSSALLGYAMTGNSKGCEGFFSMDEYKHYMVTVLNRIRKILLLDEPLKKKKSNSKKIYLKWEPEELRLALNRQIVQHDFMPNKSPVLLLNLFTKNGKFAKNVGFLRIYNEVKGESENKLDGSIEKAARGYCRELNDIFPKEYQEFLDIDNKVVNTGSCYVLEL